MTDTGSPSSTTSDDEFAAALRAERERQGWTQGRLADEMSSRGHEFRQQTIAKIENGVRRVSIGEARDFAAVFDVSLEDLAPPLKESGMAATRRAGNELVRGLIATSQAVNETIKRQSAYAKLLDENKPEWEAEITLPNGDTYQTARALMAPLTWRGLQKYRNEWTELLEDEGMKAALFALGWNPASEDEENN